MFGGGSRGNVAMIDRWLNLFPPGAGGDEWYTLQLRVTQQLYREKQVDLALARARYLLSGQVREHAAGPPQGRLRALCRRRVSPARGEVPREGRSSRRTTTSGRAIKEFAPEDNEIKLLRALAMAGMKDLGKAQQVLAALPKDTKGYNEVTAILEDGRIHDELTEDDLAAPRRR